MKPPPSSEHDEQDQKIIKLLKELGSIESEYPSELLTARRAAFLAQVEQLSPAEISEELSAGDQEIAQLLGNLKASQVEYPPELLTARRAAFLAQVEQLSPVEISEELSAGDEEIVKLLGNLKSAQVEYPPQLLAARRSAFLHQAATAGGTSVWDRLRVSIQRRFTYKPTVPTVPSAGFTRLSLVIASLLVAVLIGSLFFNRTDQPLSLFPSQVGTAPTQLLPTSTAEVALTICTPEDQTPACSSEGLPPSQDLADPGNGAARPAVSKDARSGDNGAHRASYVNDGREGASWVSNSPNSWIKIDLGKVTKINTVSLQKGSPDSSDDNNLGQFVIAVALSDVYTDGNSSYDFMEYSQVFNSEDTGFSGTVSRAETISTRFPPTEARFIKITFKQAGAAIEEVGVFMVPPPEPEEQATSTPQDDLPGITLTPLFTNTALPTNTATSVPTGTRLPTDTAVLLPTNTLPPGASSTPLPLSTHTRPPWSTSTLLPTNTRPPFRTPTPLPTYTGRPADTSTPVPTDPLPTDTPIPLPTVATPTAIPPTAIPPTVQLPPPSTDPIVVTGSDQTLTFTCNGNAAEIRGHANTVTLLGSCSSITVTGNGNRVFWQSGSPVITNRGTDNIVSQR